MGFGVSGPLGENGMGGCLVVAVTLSFFEDLVAFLLESITHGALIADLSPQIVVSLNCSVPFAVTAR